jgi:hypothetical protein
MPGAQARGTHSFDPGSSSSGSASQALDIVNAEDDGEEDQAGPPVDTPMANMPAAFSSAISSLFPPAPDTVSLGGASSSQSNAIPPPMSSSISPTTHRGHARHVNPALSHTTSSDTPTTSSMRKRKRDATADMPPPSSKRVSRNKTETLNPVIISSQLNSTLVRLADVMEKSLDVSATSVDSPTTLPTPSSHASSSTPSQPSPPSSSSTSSSDSEIIDNAVGIVTADRAFLSEDDLFAAILFFSNTSNEVVRVARNYIALSNLTAVQRRYLLHQLTDAGLRSGKGKGKATANDDDDFPMLE